MTKTILPSIPLIDSSDTGLALTMLRQWLTGCEPAFLIDGTWRRSEATIDVDDPATGEHLASIATATEADIDQAVSAARHAFQHGPWTGMRPFERAALLHALADAIEKHQETLALLESLDAGHAIRSVRHGDIPHGIRSLRDYAGWATKLTGDIPMGTPQQTGMDYFLRQPVGVVGIITPWNAPFLMMLQKLAAALAAGCTVVVKPAELAPLSALLIGELCLEVGIPDGVVNIVTGTGAIAGQALAEHPDVNMISFTGSTAVGKSIMVAAAHSNLKRVVLELGGKSPVIVFADTDLDKAAQAITREITFKCGQYCAAGSRIFVQRGVFQPLLERIRTIMGQVRIGPGHDEASDMGPMISDAQRRRAANIIEHSVVAGARIICGGHARAGNGYFFEPTLLSDITADMRVAREEIFAPVLTMTAFDDDVEPAGIAAMANDSRYGLSAKVWTRDMAKAHALINLLESGQVIVNGGGNAGAILPFGGMKESGYGRENGHVGLSHFTETKAVRLGYGT